MEGLKAEMERKRKAVEKTGLVTAEKKYFKRGDLAKKMGEEYIARMRKIKGFFPETDDDGGRKREKKRQPSSSSSFLDDMLGDDFEKHMPGRSEVIRRLRERNEPIRLFSESDIESFQRLRKLEILEPEVNKGMRNDFKAAMDKVDAAYLSELQKTVEDGDSVNPSEEGASKEGGEPKNLVQAVDLQLSFEDIKRKTDRLSDPDILVDKACDAMLATFNYILKLWSDDLNSRDEKNRRTMKAKLDTATYNQTVTYLKPLLRRFRKRTIPDDIFAELKVIAMNLMNGEYVRANDAYYMIAIGNAAWPIGVTMVGIHARTGREKIFAQHVAHVLNDEQQRKYIQGLKRLMTKLQTYRPADPSKSVEFGAIKG